ncbi:cation:proton antiporter [Hyphococcus flavus]|uniref:Cation:proton antiporter n=1 Tax=Hyphococcus flavus TaxID=1866326 RepID=A0AAE9ZCY7_9PROT|nr:cation:proton antiporter [Hyphococcus flavus]WDI30682.1 cation:proton antiporter [Hyphococcus flavus]
MNLIYILLVLLVVTRVCGVFAQRAGQPPLVGEILGGVFLGILISQFSGSFPVLSGLPDNEVLKGIADLGIFFLMLLAGVELRPRDLAKTSGKAFVIALAGFLVPLALGFGLGWTFIPESDFRLAQSLFIGTALAITAVPVAVKVLMDLDLLNTPVGRTIVSAAVFDDVLSLLLLAVLVAVINQGEAPSVTAMGILAGKVTLFFIITGAMGFFIFPIIGRWLMRIQVEELEFSGLVATALGYSLLAEFLELHFIIGAFVAGLFFNRRIVDNETHADVDKKIRGLTTGFLAPIFFATIGLHLDLSAVTAAPLLLFTLIVAAFIGKFAGAGVVSYFSGFNKRQSAAIGGAMSARGAVELIVANIALEANLFSRPEPAPPEVESLFSAVVIVAIVTTVATPMIIRRTLYSGENKDGAV